jgi:hypothetical protein
MVLLAYPKLYGALILASLCLVPGAHAPEPAPAATASPSSQATPSGTQPLPV